MTHADVADSATPRVFGIDLGSQRCVVAAHTGDLVLNELGGMTTATLVSFKGEERLIGESAVLSSSTNPQNTIDSLHLLVGQSFETITTRYERIPGQRARIKQCPSMLLSSDAVVVVEYHGENEKFFYTEQLLAMLLRKLAHPMKLEPTDQIHIAIPSAWTIREQRALHIAARIGGLANVSLVTREAALAACYHSKHPIQEQESEKHIVIVDMGHTSTSVALVQFTVQGPTVISTACDVTLGAENLDLVLYEYFKQQVIGIHGWKVSHHGKEGKRLLAACEKLKRLLSTIDKATVTVENIVPDHDYTLTLSRETMESLWTSEMTRLEGLLRQLTVEKEVVIESVEIVGGGTRIPSVQQRIAEVFSISGLGRRLDSTTSIAVGAALAVSSASPVTWEWTEEENEGLTTLVAAEEEMEARDMNLTAIAHERNAIESFIYDMRSKQQDLVHGSKLDPVVLDPLLETAEEWLYSEASEQASLVEMQTKRQEIQQEIQLACTAYFTAIAKDQDAMEAELEAQAQLAEQERLVQGEENVDYDTRKLKNPERIRLITKNKEEGTELFQDGNYQHAVMRYVKALSHVTKVLDPTPTEQIQLSSLKLSLYLNLAQCYIKLQQWTKVIGNCQEALNVDSTSVKALYRRAVAYEQLQQMDEATKDIQAALILAPEDKAVIKMDGRLKQWHKKQLEKEKKMWGKAFA